MFAEAVITSAYVKFTLLFLPFRKVAGWLGTPRQEVLHNDLAGKSELIEKIRFVVRLTDKYTPWPTECYTKSLTAKIMLRRRQLASTLFFGFRKDRQGGLKGHAWLQCAGITVTGFCDFSKYEIHSQFS